MESEQTVRGRDPFQEGPLTICRTKGQYRTSFGLQALRSTRPSENFQTPSRTSSGTSVLSTVITTRQQGHG